MVDKLQKVVIPSRNDASRGTVRGFENEGSKGVREEGGGEKR
jgi:hypothetical protein